jgi:hypothetical protein
VAGLFSAVAVLPAKQPLLVGVVEVPVVVTVILGAPLLVDSATELSTAIVKKSALPPLVVGGAWARAMAAAKLVLVALAVLSVVGMTRALLASGTVTSEVTVLLLLVCRVELHAAVGPVGVLHSILLAKLL